MVTRDRFEDTGSMQLAYLARGDAAGNQGQNKMQNENRLIPRWVCSVLGGPSPQSVRSAVLVALESSGCMFIDCVAVNVLLVLSYKMLVLTCR